MIIGIGIDMVVVVRFEQWHKKTPQQLLRIFSPKELAYCLQNPAMSAQHFAVRFAAKEAFLKAATSIYPHLTFLQACKWVQVDHIKNRPVLIIDNFADFRCHVSLSHTQVNAIACVVIEKTG